MLTFEAWLSERGPAVAEALEQQRELICDSVSKQLAAKFPTLCYDPTRYDALAFQQLTFHETPRRFHCLVQVLLQLQSLEVIEREYRWGWPIVQRYGVERYHLLAQVRWYFKAASAHTTLVPEDDLQMNHLALAIVQIIEHVTSDHSRERANGHVHQNGFHS